MGTFCVETAIIISKKYNTETKLWKRKYHAFVSKKICMHSKRANNEE